MAERLTKATAGLTFDLDGEHATVCEKCKNGKRGFWVCCTCGISFPTQFDKDSHINRGEHTLAWYCLECGTVEVP